MNHQIEFTIIFKKYYKEDVSILSILKKHNASVCWNNVSTYGEENTGFLKYIRSIITLRASVKCRIDNILFWVILTDEEVKRFDIKEETKEEEHINKFLFE